MKRRLTDNFSWGLFVWDKAIFMRAWLNPFESSDDATPTFRNLQILTMAKIYKVYGMVLIQPSVKQKPGIRMLINCERRSLDKEKQKRKKIY